jgi:hypothetical protein
MSYSEFKFRVFQHYWWILIVFAILFTVWFCYLDKNSQNITLFLTVLGGTFSLFFLIQKQKLEELTLFKSLFENFNCRYDELNEKLNKISDDDKELTDEEKNTLNDYFNLCAEEYFFFEKGYIYPEVWKAWEKGMGHFFAKNKIKKYWTDEEVKESYYNFDPDALLKDKKG